MKSLIDANVILRYLLNDIPEQAHIAKQTIIEGAYSLPEVIAEVVYVLKGVYKVDRAEIAEALNSILQEITVENSEMVIEALQIFADKNLDFVDCILIAHHRLGKEKVVSFDKRLNYFL